ncbi:DinB family protein [Heyndrickxia sporothermodurans]
MSEAELSLKPQPHKWSKKEIMGHLCDSAIANLDRFIKIQYEKQPFVFSSYNQDQWVERQNYQDTPMEDIIVISRIPNEKLLYQCEIGNQEMQTLEWLIQDYLEHMEHHLKDQVFNS